MKILLSLITGIPLKIIIFIPLFFFCSRTNAQIENDSLLINYYRIIIQTLANDSFGGRPTSTVYEKMSADFIACQFKSCGFKSKFHSFRFQAKDSTSISKSINVYCFINNKADSTIIIGAHYDHIGLGGPLSRSLGKRGVHNGADDNASGVALLLGLSKNLKTWNNINYNYLLVAYSAHEIGLYGSAAFCTLASKKYKPISLVVNFDMVGRMYPTERWLKVMGVNSLAKEKTFFDPDPAKAGIHREENFGLRYRLEPDSMLNQLDTRAYYQLQIPCLAISTGVHDDYHKLTDDESKINYVGILSIQKLLEGFLKNY